MVIKYSAPELIAIGEMVILKECIARIPNQQQSQQELEPQYHHVYVPPTSQDTFIPQRMSSSISADNFLQDFAQFQHNLDQSIQLNRDISCQEQATKAQQEREQQKLTNSVAEFFKKAQQNFHPNPSSTQADSTSTRARRLSEVEAELLGQLKGHIHL